jgi:hypothetical protein
MAADEIWLQCPKAARKTIKQQEEHRVVRKNIKQQERTSLQIAEATEATGLQQAKTEEVKYFSELMQQKEQDFS